MAKNTTRLNRSNPFFAEAVDSYRDFTEDDPLAPLFDYLHELYMDLRMEYVIDPVSDPVLGEQRAFDEATSADCNGTGVEVYAPAFQKYLESVKDISREIPYARGGRRVHGG